jgi:hypothetical protein
MKFTYPIVPLATGLALFLCLIPWTRAAPLEAAGILLVCLAAIYGATVGTRKDAPPSLLVRYPALGKLGVLFTLAGVLFYAVAVNCDELDCLLIGPALILGLYAAAGFAALTAAEITWRALRYRRTVASSWIFLATAAAGAWLGRELLEWMYLVTA